ncbi:hypothetical protein M8J77_015964 [Diaphorina citri]|nr:hypothetical protein M8J77_015964 [Diaphorina citri]
MPQTGVKAEAGTGHGHVPLPASMSLKLKGQTGAQQYEATKFIREVVYKAGKEMYVSDTLSRAALKALKETCTEFDESLAQDLAIHTNMFYRTLNASDAKLNEIYYFHVFGEPDKVQENLDTSEIGAGSELQAESNFDTSEIEAGSSLQAESNFDGSLLQDDDTILQSSNISSDVMDQSQFQSATVLTGLESESSLSDDSLKDPTWFP